MMPRIDQLNHDEGIMSSGNDAVDQTANNQPASQMIR